MISIAACFTVFTPVIVFALLLSVGFAKASLSEQARKDWE